jgi:threonine/homoserine/homoserine lactone efflux protein
MDGSNFALFFAASWILIITPGPDMIYVITKGVSQGRKAGVISAIGITLGILVHTVFAACGLAIILKTSAMVFVAVKFVGAGYLVFLGIKAIKDKTAFTVHNDQPQVKLRTVFIQGVLSNVLNPKIALFFLAFLPQFVNPQYGNASVQMVCLGLIFALLGVIFLVLLGYFSGTIGSWISRRRQLTRKIRWFTGGVLILLGLRLAFVDRR